MIIRDKQSLRRCVKQAVRRAEIVETALCCDVRARAAGLPRRLLAGPGTPFSPDVAALCAALDALDLPAYDIERAEREIEAYDPDAYLRALMDAARARRVYARISCERAGDAFFGDDRYEPMLVADALPFAAGRYGVDYAAGARALREALAASGAKELCADDAVDLETVCHALLPLCEEEGARLHAGLTDEAQARRFFEALRAFPGARAVVWSRGDAAAERALIALCAETPQAILRLTETQNLPRALETLGTRFLAYASCAPSPLLMTGRWLNFKERLYPLLCDAYLPLARTGYELTSEAVERDVRRLLGGCLDEGAKKRADGAAL